MKKYIKIGDKIGDRRVSKIAISFSIYLNILTAPPSNKNSYTSVTNVDLDVCIYLFVMAVGTGGNILPTKNQRFKK